MKTLIVWLFFLSMVLPHASAQVLQQEVNLFNPTQTRSVDISPDGSLLVRIDAKGKGYLLKTKTGDLEATLPSAKNLLLARFDPTGNLLALMAYDGQVSVWDRKKEKVVYSHQPAQTLYDIYRIKEPFGFSRSGDRFAFPASYDRVKVVELSTGKLLLERETKVFTQVSLHPEGTSVALACTTNGIEMVDLEAGNYPDYHHHGREGIAVQFDPGGKKIMMNVGGMFSHADYPDMGYARANYLNSNGPYKVIAGSRWGHLYVQQKESTSRPRNFEVSLWYLADQELLGMLPTKKWPQLVALNPAKEQLYVIMPDGRFQVWSISQTSLDATAKQRAQIFFDEGMLRMGGFFYDEARAYFEKGYAVDSTNSRANARLAYLIAQDYNYTRMQKGVSWLTSKRGMDASDPLVQIIEAKVQLERGKYRAAISGFNQVLEKSGLPKGDVVALHFYLGKAYEATRQYNKALEHYQTYFSGDHPDSEYTTHFKFYKEMFQEEAVLARVRSKM